MPLLGLLAAGVWLWTNPDWLSGRSSFPAYKERVTDEIGYLAPATRANLTQRLVDLEAKSGAQVVFALLTDLPEQPADYARQLSDHWRVGGEDRNGILLTIFPDASKLAMDVGSGVPKLQNTHIPELIAERIQRRLNTKDVVGGVIQAMDDIVEVLTGDARAWEIKAKSLPAEPPAVIPSARPPTTYRVLPKVAGGVQNLRCRTLHRLQHCGRHSRGLDWNHHRHLSSSRRRQDDAALVRRKLARLFGLDIELLHRRRGDRPASGGR